MTATAQALCRGCVTSERAAFLLLGPLTPSRRNCVPFDPEVRAPCRRRDGKRAAEDQKSDPGRQIAVDLQADAYFHDNWRRPGHIISPLKCHSLGTRPVVVSGVAV
jgi:hypothetical protein